MESRFNPPSQKKKKIIFDFKHLLMFKMFAGTLFLSLVAKWVVNKQ